MKLNAMKIKVHNHAIDFFWESPCEDSMEFWAFNYVPSKLSKDDWLYFYNNKKLIARAKVLKITGPGDFQCAKTCHFKNKWKAFWKEDDFEDLRGKNVNVEHVSFINESTYSND